MVHLNVVCTYVCPAFCVVDEAINTLSSSSDASELSITSEMVGDVTACYSNHQLVEQCSSSVPTSSQRFTVSWKKIFICFFVVGLSW
jgi:hypothetical protein